MLPITRQMNNSPGLVWVSRQGSMRESAQVMNSASGRWPSASCSKKILMLRVDVLLES